MPDSRGDCEFSSVPQHEVPAVSGRWAKALSLHSNMNESVFGKKADESLIAIEADSAASQQEHSS